MSFIDRIMALPVSIACRLLRLQVDRQDEDALNMIRIMNNKYRMLLYYEEYCGANYYYTSTMANNLLVAVILWGRLPQIRTA